jgi:hypothetical protein
LVGKDLIFVVNVSKGELVCGTVVIGKEDLHRIYGEKLVDYM